MQGRVFGEMLIVHTCQEFKWDYETYMQQPSWFIEMINKKFEIDGKQAKQESTKAKLSKK